MKKLFYPAIFTPEENGGFSVSFPDVDGCFTQGDNIDDAYEMAVDALGLMLTYLQEEKRPVPQPSLPNKLTVENGQFVVVIEFDMLSYLKKNNNKAVKKTLTIPQWLNEEAVARNINFSQVLQEALLEKCR